MLAFEAATAEIEQSVCVAQTEEKAAQAVVLQLGQQEYHRQLHEAVGKAKEGAAPKASARSWATGLDSLDLVLGTSPVRNNSRQAEEEDDDEDKMSEEEEEETLH